MIRKSANIAVLFIIVLLGLLFHRNYINEFPSHTHAWAQSDRYAIAHGFVNNNSNFFKPETFIYNHQFPHRWQQPSSHTITAVDFPIHDYIPSLFMRVLNNNSPWIFRSYTLLYSLIGLFFLFRFTRLITDNNYKSIFVTIFTATSPVFVYYQAGFLPTIPSLANAFIGIYFYTQFLLSKNNRSFNITILFLTLATLSRTTFAIPLIAVMGFELLRVMTHKSSWKPKLVPIFTSISLIVFYVFYNNYLRATYGSNFLNELRPLQGWDQFIFILNIVKEKWLTAYFSSFHYVILTIILCFILFNIFLKKISFSSISRQLLLLTAIMFIGCIAFSLLMFSQFRAHDYYFLDTFFLPVILSLVFLLSITPRRSYDHNNYILTTVLFLVSIPLVTSAMNTLKERHRTDPWDNTAVTITNFKDSKSYLDSLGIAPNSKILVLDGKTPNIPFILMNRKGYVVMITSKENIEVALEWNYDYIITQNEFFLSDIYANYPEIITRTEPLWNNGKITISKLRSSATNITLNEYLGLDKKTPLREETIRFEEASTVIWNNVVLDSTHVFKGDKSCTLRKGNEFGLSYKSNSMPELRNHNTVLTFQSHFLHESNGDVEVVVSINEDGQSSYYKSYNLKMLLPNKKEWKQVNLIYNLPKVKGDDYEFAIYVWNKGNTELFIDDFGFKIY